MYIKAFIREQFLICLALVTLVYGCSSFSSQPAFSKDQAIQRATNDAKQSMPEYAPLETRIDNVTAELITLAEADKRFGGQTGPGGYAPGQTPDSPVWWVTVRGLFRYEGMPAADGWASIYLASERDFTYDARTGESVGSFIPGPGRLVATVTYPVTVERPSTARVAPAPTATANPPTPTAQPVVIAGLTIEENPIVARGVYTPDRMEYMPLIPASVRDKRGRERNLTPAARVKSANEVLSKFGYRLAHDPPLSSYTYLLLKDDRQVLGDINYFRPPTLNARGDDFVIWLGSEKNGEKLVRKDGIQDWKPGPYASAYAPPILYGNDLLSAHWETANNSAAGQVIVQQDGKTVYSIPATFYVDDPLKGLWAWNGHWVLEVAGQVIVDGKNQNQALGYDEMFEWHSIHGQPFYFFKKNNQIGVSYAGQVLPSQYDEVMYYRCCEPAIFNPGSTEDMIWFHARRGETWYYVEMGVYE